MQCLAGDYQVWTWKNVQVDWTWKKYQVGSFYRYRLIPHVFSYECVVQSHISYVFVIFLIKIFHIEFAFQFIQMSTSSTFYWLSQVQMYSRLRNKHSTPVRTLSISGLKSRVMKLPFLSLKMMVKSGLEFILKLTEPLQRYLLSCHANSAILGRYFCTGQQQLWRGSVNFKITKNLDILEMYDLFQKCWFQALKF